jgi:hypothetical protein
MLIFPLFTVLLHSCTADLVNNEAEDLPKPSLVALLELSADADEGDDFIDGDLMYILVTAFSDVTEDSGQVWVVPSTSQTDTKDLYTLISGLKKPLATCFDMNHDLLYVVDSGYEEGGHIWQYSIDWNWNYDFTHKFALKSDEAIDVYSGPSPADCVVDEYGNLYFVETSESTVNSVHYMDLWAGYSNAYYTLYEQADFNSPVALDVRDSKDLWVVNNVKGTTHGVLLHAQANSRFVNQGQVDAVLHDFASGWGVTSDDEFVYFSVEEGEVWAYDITHNSSSLKSRDFYSPRGLCYGDSQVFVVDEGDQAVYRLHDGDSLEEDVKLWVKVKGAYDVFCISWALVLECTLISVLVL